MSRKPNIHSVLLISGTDRSPVKDVMEEIKEYLLDNSIKYHHTYRDEKQYPVKNSFDLAISIGGDGTVLYASRLLSLHNIPLLPVNLGEFGFITEISRNEWKETLELYLQGKITVGKRVLVNARLLRKEQEVESFIGLNDVVLSSAGVSKLVCFTVHLGKDYLGKYRSDGIIVSTPTGSTAYSVAAGGPILHPEMSALILNPICPFTLSHRPLVLPETEELTIHVEKKQRTKLLLSIDGQDPTRLLPNDDVLIKLSKKRVHIIRSNHRSFYEVLRTKLNWAGTPYA